MKGMTHNMPASKANGTNENNKMNKYILETHMKHCQLFCNSHCVIRYQKKKKKKKKKNCARGQIR